MPHSTITTNYDYDAPHRSYVVVRTLTRLLHAILSSCRFPTATCHTPFFIYDDSIYEGNHSGTAYAYDDHPAEAKTTFNTDYDDSRQLWPGRAQHRSESKLADIYDDQTPPSSTYHGTYIDEPIAKLEDGSPIYYHCNRKYDVAGLTDSTGTIVELYAYTPYGTQTVMDASGVNIGLTAQNNPYGFTGRRLDEETGLWYFRARYFDSELGRFISRDPIGYVDGMSLYAGYFAIRFGGDPSGLVSEIADECKCSDVTKESGWQLATAQSKKWAIQQANNSCQHSGGAVAYAWADTSVACIDDKNSQSVPCVSCR